MPEYIATWWHKGIHWTTGTWYGGTADDVRAIIEAQGGTHITVELRGTTHGL